MGEHAEVCPAKGLDQPRCTCGDGALESWRGRCADLEAALREALGIAEDLAGDEWPTDSDRIAALTAVLNGESGGKP